MLDILFCFYPLNYCSVFILWIITRPNKYKSLTPSAPEFIIEEEKPLKDVQCGWKKTSDNSYDKERPWKIGKVSQQRDGEGIVSLDTNILGILPESKKIGNKMKPRATENKIGKMKKVSEGAAAARQVRLNLECTNPAEPGNHSKRWCKGDTIGQNGRIWQHLEPQDKSERVSQRGTLTISVSGFIHERGFLMIGLPRLVFGGPLKKAAANLSL